MPQIAPSVLVLKPVKDAEHHLDRYVTNIETMDYPKEFLSIGVLESNSRDRTIAILKRLLPRLQARRNRVTVAGRDFGFRLPAGVAALGARFHGPRIKLASSCVTAAKSAARHLCCGFTIPGFIQSCLTGENGIWLVIGIGRRL